MAWTNLEGRERPGEHLRNVKDDARRRRRYAGIIDDTAGVAK